MTIHVNKTNHFEIKQGDTSPQLETQLIDGDGVLLDLTDAISVTLSMTGCQHPRTQVLVNAAAEFTADATGTVWYEWQAANTAVVGKYDIEWTVNFPLGGVMTFPSKGFDTVEVTRSL